MLKGDALVQVRINSEMKTKAAEIVGKMGLTLSDVVRMAIFQIVNEGAYVPPAVVDSSGAASTTSEPSLNEDEDLRRIVEENKAGLEYLADK
jgi:addiction module RelB/DinJ family antitoxin